MPLLFRWQKKKNARGRWVELRWAMEEEQAAHYAAKVNVEQERCRVVGQGPQIASHGLYLFLKNSEDRDRGEARAG
jgi:hypothetical protein